MKETKQMQPYLQEKLFHFTYDLDTRIVEQDDMLAATYGLKKYYEDMPYSFVNEVVHEDDRATYTGMYERIISGDQFATCDFRVRGSELWSRVSLYRSNMESSVVEGFVQDVTSFYAYIIEQANERDTERQRRLAMERDYMRLITAVNDTYNMVLFQNLTQNTYHLINGQTDTRAGVDGEGILDELVKKGLERVPKEFKADYEKHFSRESLLEAYSDGKKEIYFEYLYDMGQDGPQWMNSHVIFNVDPYNGDILAVTMSQNIDDRKHKEEADEAARRLREIQALQLMRGITDTYDLVIAANLTKNRYHMVNYDRYLNRSADEEGFFDDLIEVGISTVPDIHKESFRNAFSREALLKAYAEGKKDVYLDHQQYDNSGELHWISTHVIFTENPYDNDILEITLSQNIDERILKETEAERIKRERELEALQLTSVLKSAYDVVVSVNLTNRTYNVLGGIDYSNGEIPFSGELDILIKWVYDHVTDEYKKDFLAFVNRSFILNTRGTENYLSLEHKTVETDGSEHWVLTDIMLGDNPYSDDMLAIVTRRNIDERKRKEAEAERFRREKEIESTQLASVMKASFETVTSVNLTKRTYYIVSGEDYFGGQIPHAGDLDALIEWVVNQMTEEFRDGYIKLINQDNILSAHGNENFLSYEHKCIEADGMEHWVVTDMLMGENPYSDDLFAVVVRRNIAERKRKDEEQMRLLSDALALAENASRAKSDFLSRMSHDIRTPMNAVIGYATIAASHIDERGRVKDSLKKILSSGEHLQGLINDVLDMSRIEAGKESLNLVRTTISEMVRTVLPMVQSQIASKQIELYVDTIDVTDEYIYADVQKMRQLLLNILGNAVKFTSNGGKISIKIKQTAAHKLGNATYTFLIKDTGIGMSKEFQKHLFETFAQERTSTNSKQLGTGLGMAIAKSYVDMMGGTISVESEVGKGTEFAVKLELKLQEDVKPDARLEQLKGYRALVVDDDFQSCDSVVHMLRDIGMRADFTTTGKEALFRTRMAYGDGDSYFAYIIDWIMPDMNGIELVRQIRKIIGDEVPIIILTAYYWGDIEQEAIEAGVTAFCTKPLFTSDLTNIFLQHENVAENTERFENERILLVEDNDLNREIAKFMLEEIGFEVDIACDGDDAVHAMEKCEDGWYNYVLMDVQMPIMDGIEATRCIRNSEREYLKQVPIIALTANAFNDDVERCISAGMNAHLAKPFKIEDIITALNSFKK